MAESPWIREATVQTFQEVVIEQSMERPVVVDLWAPWCGPCRQLGPVLEKLAQEFQGKFCLVKVNTDENPEIAQAFRVDSLPYVVAIREGRAINEFVGLQPEAEIRKWLATLVPSPAEELLRKGESLEATDPRGAEQCYRQALELEPHDEIRIVLARVLLAQGRDEEAAKIVAELEARGYLEPEAHRIKSQLELRAAAGEAGTIREARAAAVANPNDLSLQVKLADVLAAEKKYGEALETCLAVVQKDKLGAGAAAKDTMVKVFELMGPGSELAGEYRRKLATALY